MNIIIDVISCDILNLIDIVREVIQHRTNKIKVLIRALKGFYFGVPLIVFHEILKCKCEHDPYDLFVLLRSRLTQKITIETLTLLYNHNYFDFIEYIIPSIKQRYDFYNLVS